MNGRRSRWSGNTWWVVAIFLGALLTSHCSNQATSKPIVAIATPCVKDLCLNHDSNELLPGEEVEIWIPGINIPDPSTPIVHKWHTEGGEIIKGLGTEKITFKAPAVPGSYRVVLNVEYGGWKTERFMSIIVPTPTPTPTQTGTPTSTPTPAPTHTPTPTVTPSHTPTPTDTPTVTPTSTSTPIPPEAIVIAAKGVDLRSGPGSDYDVVETIHQGDILDVQRRVYGKDDWLQVSAKLDSGDVITEWVQIDPAAVKVNVDVGSIPRMYEFGPKLIEPTPYASRPTDELITFKWVGVGSLEDYQYYSLILVPDGQSDDKACYHWQPQTPEASLKPEDYGCTTGAYHWGVGIATDLNKGKGERDWRDDSLRDERNPIGIGMPYPNSPKATATSSSVHIEPPGN
jgi:hypothetical protein